MHAHASTAMADLLMAGGPLLLHAPLHAEDTGTGVSLAAMQALHQVRCFRTCVALNYVVWEAERTAACCLSNFSAPAVLLIAVARTVAHHPDMVFFCYFTLASCRATQIACCGCCQACSQQRSKQLPSPCHPGRPMRLACMGSNRTGPFFRPVPALLRCMPEVLPSAPFAAPPRRGQS